MSQFQEILKGLGTLDVSRLYKTTFPHLGQDGPGDRRGVCRGGRAAGSAGSGTFPRGSFDSGLGISLFRDNSTRTRFSSPAPATCWAWRSRTWTKARARRPRRDRAGDRQYDLLHGRCHRYPGRYVHRKGSHLYAVRSRRGGRGLPGRGAGAAAYPGESPVRYRPPHPVHGRYASYHSRVWRRREPEGQEGGHDLGVLTQLR